MTSLRSHVTVGGGLAARQRQVRLIDCCAELILISELFSWPSMYRPAGATEIIIIMNVIHIVNEIQKIDKNLLIKVPQKYKLMQKIEI